MPRPPASSPTLAHIRESAFSSLAHRLAAHRGEVYPLHVGDTWLDPPGGCRMEDLRACDHPGLHRYAPPQGVPALLDAVVERVRARTGVATERGDVLIAAGATGGLGAALGAVLSPGDEVLVLAPYWPLIDGIVRSFHGVPVAVPFLGEVDSPESAVECVAAQLGERTVALYLNTPNNPTGRILPRAWLEALAEWTRRAGLWLFADEVYEDYAYAGPHTYCRSLAPERTFSVHSFSKAFGMAGNRCGYVVGPSAVMQDVRKVSTHSVYSTATASQAAALRSLDGRGDAWVLDARKQYQAAGNAAAAKLGIEAPEGSTFLFLDVKDALGQGGLGEFLSACVDRGLFVAPGTSFGPYPTSVRVCFTSAAPDVVSRGIDQLASLLARTG
jgi:N-succinyldiaminopimelate aminotransferase